MNRSPILTTFQVLAALHIAAALAANPGTIWSALNDSVDGRLHEGFPLSLPCFSKYDDSPIQPDKQLCEVIQGNYTSPVFRVSHFGAYMMVRSVLSCYHKWLVLTITQFYFQ